MNTESDDSHIRIGEMTIRVVVADELIQSFEASMPRGGLGPGLHRHRGMDEIFYVKSGKVITSGDSTVVAVAGDVVRVPKMTPHRWQSVDGPAEMLFTFIPGQNQVSYLRDLAALENSGASWNEGIAALREKYDNEPL